MQIDYPLRFDGKGSTATTTEELHIRHLIEQVLFTTPGERVNRPSFGSGLLQMLFAPNRFELAAASQFLVQSSLQQWLGDVINVEAVEVRNDEAQVTVTVQYTIRRTGRRQVASFSRE